MTTEQGYYDVNPAPARQASSPDGTLLFKGSGDATLTLIGFQSWKEFLRRGDRPLAEAEVERIEAATTLENFAVGGRIAVSWPEVEISFSMDDYIGRKKRKTAFIVTARQNFSTIIHPFTVTKEWMRYKSDKDCVRLNGYEWVFEQEKDNFAEYKGHVRCGRELFITFQFTADWRYHYTHK